MPHDVFVSHSSRDKAAADAVCAVLEANGVRCWIAPRDIRPGENWAAAIMRGIADSRLMVLVFSGHANDSKQVRREVERAVHHGVPIAPIRIQDVMPKEDLEYFLSSSHWMDALTPPLTKHLREFSRKVRGLLEVEGSAAPPPPSLLAATEAAPATANAPVRHQGFFRTAWRARSRFGNAPRSVRLLVLAAASATIAAAACLLLWLILIALYSPNARGAPRSHFEGQSIRGTR